MKKTLVLSTALIIGCKTINTSDGKQGDLLSDSKGVNSSDKVDIPDVEKYYLELEQGGFEGLDKNEEYILLERYTASVSEAGLGIAGQVIRHAALNEYLNSSQTMRFADPANKALKVGIVLGDIHQAFVPSKKTTFYTEYFGWVGKPEGARGVDLDKSSYVWPAEYGRDAHTRDKSGSSSSLPGFYGDVDELLKSDTELASMSDLNRAALRNANNMRALMKDLVQKVKPGESIPFSRQSEETFITQGSILPLAGHFGEVLSAKLGKTVKAVYTTSLDAVLLARAFGYGKESIAPQNLSVLMARISYDANAAKWIHQGATWLTGTGAGRVMNKFADYLEEMKKVTFFRERATTELKNLESLNAKVETLQKKSTELATANLSITAKANRIKEVETLKKEVDADTSALMNTIYKDRDFLDFRVRTASGLLEKSVLLTQKQTSNLMDWVKKKPATK